MVVELISVVVVTGVSDPGSDNSGNTHHKSGGKSVVMAMATIACNRADRALIARVGSPTPSLKTSQKPFIPKP